jgi:glycerophosphoryl diester phosphodiesterase
MKALVLLLALAPVAPVTTERPRLVGHRGLRYHAPEETLAGYAAALELRVGVEVHVRRTRDGKLVAMYDADVARTTDGKGKVEELTLAELRKLDAGSWFDPVFAGERVPTLDEVLGLLKRRSGMLALVHIQVEGAEAEVARAAAKQGVAGQVVCAGRPARDADARRKLKGSKVGAAVLAASAQELPAALTEPDADWVLVTFAPSAADVLRAHKAGRKVVMGSAVTGYDPEICRLAFEGQVDLLLTDFPLECRALWRSMNRAR